MIFAIVHFNTPELTTCLCASIKKHHPDASIVIFDNSNIRPFTNSDLFDATYFDNTKGTLINFEDELKKYKNRDMRGQHVSGCRFGSAKHSMTIEWLCNNLAENFVLLDSDVLLKKPVDFCDDKFVCCSDIMQIYKDIHRIKPMITYINVNLMHEKKIHFFDGRRMHGLVPTNTRYHWYDTGASFYEDVKRVKGLKRINSSDYIVHYGCGSWNRTAQRKVGNSKCEALSFKTWLFKYRKLWA